MPRYQRIVYLSIFFTISIDANSENILSSLYKDITGIYEVSQATLNESDCEHAGTSISYASKYIQITGANTIGFNISICNGDSLEEIDCTNGYSSSTLNIKVKDGWQGYKYGARAGRTKNGSHQCLLSAYRRKISTDASSYVSYERTDWSVSLSDYIAECGHEMAKTYSRVQSLKCSTHIVIKGIRVQ